MNRISLLLLALAGLFVTGCPRNEYVVEIKPTADGMERKLVCWREDQDEKGKSKFVEFPEEELALLKRLYPNYRFDASERKHTLDGRFTGATPHDIGGAGFLTNYVCSLGKGFLYEERFRGQDDQFARWEKRQQAADQLVDLLIGWFNVELNQEPRLDTLRSFMDHDLRRDVKNIGLYAWQGEVTASYQPEALNEFIVRVGQYFLERGYCQFKDLPLILHGLDNKAYAPELLKLLQHAVAERMGIPEGKPVPASLAFLGNADVLKASLEKYLATSEFFKAKLAAWEDAKKSNPAEAEPKPIDAFGGLVSTVIEWDYLGSTTDHLILRLATPVRPATTNGKWDEAAGKVVWDAELEQSDFKRLPAVCFATWAVPDEKFQKAHFGNVILSGEKLADYCFWRASLPEKSGQVWDEFVNSLTPGNDLVAKLDAFRLASGAVPETGNDFSDEGRRLLKAGCEQTKPAVP